MFFRKESVELGWEEVGLKMEGNLEVFWESMSVFLGRESIEHEHWVAVEVFW